MQEFNGTYLADGLKPDENSMVHKDALELLGLIHDLCKENEIYYTLVGKALLCYVHEHSFYNVRPQISIALKYSDFIRLKEILKSYIKVHSGYFLVDKDSCKQFDTLEIWFAKKSKVSLPENRKEDEIYYDVYLSIIPIFFAGNTEREFEEIKSISSYTMNVLNARAPIPQRTLYIRWKKRKKIRSDALYRKDREKINLDETESRMANMYAESEYCLLFPSKKIQREYIDCVHEVEFEGVKCFVSVYSQELAAKYSRKSLKYRVSDLSRQGGELLRRVQKVQTELLVEFDRVCRKNGIRYNIAFGTLLGAVRHKGFIPWDDDIDVIVPIDDYLKLDDAMKRDLDTSKFFWRTIDTEIDYNLTFKHLKRNGTVYKKPGRDQFNFHEGILIDVFPVFHAANNRIAHWIQSKVCFFFRRAVWAYMGAESERNKYKRAFYNWIKKRGVRKNYDSFMKAAQASKHKNDFYSYYNGVYRSPYHTWYLSEEAFNDPIELEFEGHKFLAPRNYEDALSYCFGEDYVLYPKMKDRFPSHFAIVDIGNLYKEC